MANITNGCIPFLFLLSIGFASLSEISYTAAVVEYHPIGGREDNASFILSANVAEYESFIKEAKVQGADIVVFPEYGLTGLAPSDSRDLVVQFAQTIPSAPVPPIAIQVPCLSSNSSMAIRHFSCSARKNKIYVVVNLPEVITCKPNDIDCPEDGFYIYNTNVAFDRNGGVIAKYHKYNLFKEPSINKPKEATLSTFDTDFGITFGMFICFDILFKEPALNVVKVMNVSNIIFSTAWFSEIPFLTAVQTQESWSFGLDVNLLASGYDDPESASGGSGIYAGRKGSLVSIMPSVSGSQLLIAQVPLSSSDCQICRENLVRQHFLRTSPELQTWGPATTKRIIFHHDDLSNYTFSRVLNNGSNDIELCSDNFCCNFHADVQLSDESSENLIYRFVITNSERFHANTYICGLIYCIEGDIRKCIYYPNDPQTLDTIIFKSIRISGNFPSPQMVLPNTLVTSLKPILESMNFKSDEYETILETTKVIQGLLTFAIIVRNFDNS